MPFVHLPVQSGSDRILAAMNRKHTLPNISMSSTVFAASPRHCIFIGFIVGFPGETAEDFAAPSHGHTNRYVALIRSNIRRGPARRRRKCRRGVSG